MTRSMLKRALRRIVRQERFAGAVMLGLRLRLLFVAAPACRRFGAEAAPARFAGRGRERLV